MKKKLLLLVVASVPALLYLNVWQAFRYRAVEVEIQQLEDTQRSWLEKNKKVIVGIEVLGAPMRIDELASEIDGLEKPKTPATFRIEIGNGGGDG